MATLHQFNLIVTEPSQMDVHTNNGTPVPAAEIKARLLEIDPDIVKHAEEAKRPRTYMADLYMAEKMTEIPIIDLLTKDIPHALDGVQIVMVHDRGANDVDDLVLQRLFERLGATVFAFDVWTSETEGAMPDGNFTLCITGPITPKADAFLTQMAKPAHVYWSLDSSLKGSNARTPKRIAFPIASVTQSEPDSEGKFPFCVPLNIPAATKKWVERLNGVPALPPREERLFTVSFGSL